MSPDRPADLRVLIRGHVLIAALFLTAFYLIFVRHGSTGSEIASRQKTLERERPEIVLVGNSLLRAAVDANEFSELSGIRTTVASCNGASSLWWYLYVKNVIATAEHKPRYVGIMFRDSFLTEPAYRVTGSYQKAIRRLMTGDDPLVEELSFGDTILDDINSPLSWVPREVRNWLNLRIERRAEDVVQIPCGAGRTALKDVFAPEKMRQSRYDEFQLAYEDVDAATSFQFASRVERSYLPHIVTLLQQEGITPVFIRARRRRDLEPAGEPAEVIQYTVDLKNYLQERGAVLIDFSDEERITAAHFGPGDHLSDTNGRELFMQLLADQLTPVVASEDVPDRVIR